MSATPFRLEVRDVAVERGQHRLVEGLAFTATGGTLLQLAGPNGCGKTSVLRALAGLAAPVAGSIDWCGRRLAPGRRGFGPDLNFIGHQPALSAELDAVENLRFQARLATAPRAVDIDTALARLGATRFARRPVRQLSAGQRQRVALARLVLFACPVWMLDEPFTALDVDARAVLEGLLDAHVAAGGIAIMATHQDFTSAHPLQRIALGRRQAA